MKILYVLNHMDWFWSHRLPLALGAREAGYVVSIAAPLAEKDLYLPGLNFNGHSVHEASGFKGILIFMKELRQLCADTKPDIVHAITLKYAFLTGLTLLFFKSRKIYTIAGLGYLFYGDGLQAKLLRYALWPLLAFVFRNKDVHLIFQNPDDRAVFIKAGLAQAEQTCVILGSGVNLTAFPHQAEPDIDVPVILMPTRLVREKGIFVFAKAAKILHKRGVAARFIIAGGLSGTNPSAMTEAEMERLAKTTPIEWAGKVDDMPALYAASTLIAYPSWYGEGVPKVLLEAAATGRAIVTTDHPGCREVVSYGENGLLVPVKNAEKLADALADLLANTAKRSVMGFNSRKRAEALFADEIVVAQTLTQYTVQKNS